MPGTITKQHLALAAYYATDRGITVDEALRVVKEALDLMAERLVAGEPVKIHEFATFVRVPGAGKKAWRTANGKRLSERMDAAPRARVVMRASRELRRRLSGGID